jgi:hypothetical protein
MVAVGSADYESEDQGFESLRARHLGMRYRRQMPSIGPRRKSS